MLPNPTIIRFPGKLAYLSYFFICRFFYLPVFYQRLALRLPADALAAAKRNFCRETGRTIKAQAEEPRIQLHAGTAAVLQGGMRLRKYKLSVILAVVGPIGDDFASKFTRLDALRSFLLYYDIIATRIPGQLKERNDI